MDCLPGLSGRLAHLQSSNILTTKMKSLLAELNMRYFNSANRYNNIFVRAHFKLQPKKNKMGEWYKELIFIESYTRHGYHRNATIECRKETENDINQPEANNSNCQK